MRTLLTYLLGFATCFALGSQVSSGQAQMRSGASDSQRDEQPAQVTTEGASGIKIYIDPQTGAILREPAPGTAPLQLTPELRNALSTSHQGLAEGPSAVPGGGFKVDLQGRFQSPLVGTIDANGKVMMQHLGEPPEPAGRD